MRYLITLLMLVTTVLNSIAQSDTDAGNIPTTVTGRFLHNITGKFDKLQDKLTKETSKTLQRLQKQEAKLYKQLQKKDSVAAKQLFAQQQSKYAAMQAKLDGADTATTTLKEYIPRFDTLKTSLSFLDQKIGKDNPLSGDLAGAKDKLRALESKMQVTNEIKKQLAARKQFLSEKLKAFNMDKQLLPFKKEVYYYSAQVKEYKELLNNPDKLEQKAVGLLRESSVFKDFMKKNSMLSQLFKLPDNYGSPQSLAGLQTRASVQQLLQQRIAAGGPNAQQMISQNLQQAQSKLQELKNKANQLGGGSSEMDMPDFKPNNQKTKSFLQRLEYGINIQSQKPNGWLPVTSDIALTVGYKISDKSTVGIGASYKLGWGDKGIRCIQFSSQGMGLRSYVDVKLKGSFWLCGGYEQNYQQAFNKIDLLKDISHWQQSGLIGITKKYKIGKKTSNMQLLWDFLSYQQIPKTPAIKFRVGYTF